MASVAAHHSENAMMNTNSIWIFKHIHCTKCERLLTDRERDKKNRENPQKNVFITSNKPFKLTYHYHLIIFRATNTQTKYLSKIRNYFRFVVSKKKTKTKHLGMPRNSFDKHIINFKYILKEKKI